MGTSDLHHLLVLLLKRLIDFTISNILAFETFTMSVYHLSALDMLDTYDYSGHRTGCIYPWVEQVVQTYDYDLIGIYYPREFVLALQELLEFVL